MGDTVLDIGCGWGRHLLVLAREGFKVTGLEFSEEAIVQARDNLREANLYAQLVQGDMHALPFDEGSFDSAISIQVFGYNDWVGAERSFREVSRILKPEGFFFLRVRSDQRPIPDGAVVIDRKNGITYKEMREGLEIVGHSYTLQIGGIETTCTKKRP